MTTDRALQTSLTSLTRAGCAQLFFVYPGRADVVRDRGINFLSLIRSAGLGDRNLALVADPYNDNYARGAGEAIPDLPALLDWHRRLLREHPGVTEFYHLGHSSGGYGALLFGHLLGARKVWAVVPRAAKAETADAAKATLKELLSAGSGATEYVIYYSPLNGRDCAFAAYFASCPGVVLAPYELPPPRPASPMAMPVVDIESWHHWGVMRTMIDSGDLRHFMPPFRPAASGGSPMA